MFHPALFKGMTVVVTGAGRGIGLEVARQFLDCGARVLVHAGRSIGELPDFLESAATEGRAHVVTADFLAPDGVCVFTTVTTDSAAGQNLMDWWYVGPINGHISLFSKAAIAHMAHRHGMQVRHSNGLHILYREPSALLESTFTALELDPEDTIIGTSAACDIDS